MTLTTADAELDDIDALIDVNLSAFAGSPYNDRLFGQVTSAQWKLFLLAQFQARIQQPATRLVKAELDGMLVGYIQYNILNGETKAGPKSDNVAQFPKGTNIQLYEEHRAKCSVWKKGLKAAGSMLYINTLVTDPSHQHKGIGSALVRVAVKNAADYKLPVYLLGSPAAVPFWKAKGFKACEDVIETDDGTVQVYPMKLA